MNRCHDILIHVPGRHFKLLSVRVRFDLICESVTEPNRAGRNAETCAHARCDKQCKYRIHRYIKQSPTRACYMCVKSRLFLKKDGTIGFVITAAKP